MATPRRIAIAAGGTAGHVYPALALADQYRRLFPETEFLFIGTANGLESRLIPARGYPVEIIRGGPLIGEGVGGKIRSLGNSLVGAAQARRLFKAKKIRLVIGFGGYASAGAFLAARTLGLRTAIHEANVIPGLANRRLGRLVDRVYLASEKTQAAFPKSRTMVTGNPVRQEIVSVRHKRTTGSDLSGSRLRILVTGGSGGADFLNRSVPALLPKVAACGFTVEVLHQAGEVFLEPIRSAYSRAGVAASVTTFIDDMAEAYVWADFVIGSAGSQTISELRVCNLPALLVPLSTATADHQIPNAMAFAEAGEGLWVREEEWAVDPLASAIASFFRDFQSRKNPSSRVEPPIELEAAQKLVADCEEMMKGRW
jgi:UDP-N-acetylglucosamine--N-acetylmuramyl-(pentapeptide) pyrophosphoryl-undecaprenol N-acetylglucosamine transferase